MKHEKIFKTLKFTTYIIICILLISLTPQKSAADSPVKAKAKKTVEAVSDFAATTKDEFEKEVHEKLAVLDQEIVTLRDKTQSEKGKIDASIQRQLNAVEANRRALVEKLDNLKSSTQGAWSHLRDGVKTAWKDLKISVDRAGDQYSKEPVKKSPK